MKKVLEINIQAMEQIGWKGTAFEKTEWKPEIKNLKEK